jgi:hypothetical protein
MRAYTVAATAVTLDVPVKWVDNALSHHHVPGVAKRRQGVARKLSYQAVLTLEVALRIVRALGAPLPRSIELATVLISDPKSRQSLGPASGLSLGIDIESIEAHVARLLAHAVEVAPSPRRGRPTTRK